MCRVHVCTRVYMCVCVGGVERELEIEKNLCWLLCVYVCNDVCVCVCVCLCVCVYVCWEGVSHGKLRMEDIRD